MASSRNRQVTGNVRPGTRTVGGGLRAPSSALPMGAESIQDPMKLTPVAPGGELLHALLAVSHAKEVSDVLSSNVAGFVHVTAVALALRTLTYLAPSPGPLPGAILLLGSIRSFTE